MNSLILLLYGASGSGKTWFAGTCDNSLYINAGGGIDTLESPLFKSKHPNINRTVVNIHETFEGNTVKKATGLDKLTDTLDRYIDNNKREHKTIIIDDATALKTFARLRGIEVVDDLAGKSGSSRRKLNRFIDITIADYNREMMIIEWFLQQYIPIFKSEGINLILIAHERRNFGKASKAMEERPLKDIKPGFTGTAFPDDVPKHFDEVWYVSKGFSEKNGTHSKIKTDGGGIELVKSRNAGVFPRFIINGSFEDILALRESNVLHPSYQIKK